MQIEMKNNNIIPLILAEDRSEIFIVRRAYLFFNKHLFIYA